MKGGILIFLSVKKTIAKVAVAVATIGIILFTIHFVNTHSQNHYTSSDVAHRIPEGYDNYIDEIERTDAKERIEDIMDIYLDLKHLHENPNPTEQTYNDIVELQNKIAYNYYRLTISDRESLPNGVAQYIDKLYSCISIINK